MLMMRLQQNRLEQTKLFIPEAILQCSLVADIESRYIQIKK